MYVKVWLVWCLKESHNIKYFQGNFQHTENEKQLKREVYVADPLNYSSYILYTTYIVQCLMVMHHIINRFYIRKELIIM